VGCRALPRRGECESVTILEALLALVILGLSAVGYLDVFQGGARAVSAADDWTHTIQVAEAGMEAAALGDALQAQEALRGADARFSRNVQVRAYSRELNEIVVTVTSPRGVSFTLRRLVRAVRSSGPGASR
jgi:type IV secretory pathway TrbL component